MKRISATPFVSRRLLGAMMHSLWVLFPVDCCILSRLVCSLFSRVNDSIYAHPSICLLCTLFRHLYITANTFSSSHFPHFPSPLNSRSPVSPLPRHQRHHRNLSFYMYNTTELFLCIIMFAINQLALLYPKLIALFSSNVRKSKQK